MIRTQGQVDGFQLGRSHGYRVGFCDAYSREASREADPHWDIHILYVTAGIGVPYPALDEAVIDALRNLTKATTVAFPSDNIVALAKKIRPDLILVLNGVVLPADQVAQLRQDGFRTAVWFTDDPYYTDWTVSIAPDMSTYLRLSLTFYPFTDR